MKVLRRGALAGAALAAIAAPLAVGAPAANAAEEIADCFSDYPDAYNGENWKAYTADQEGGIAQFEEYGEHLYIADWKSEGLATKVLFHACIDGEWELYDIYDSGPNEGDTDYEHENLSFAEGRRIAFQVCNYADDVYSNCGDMVYGIS